MAELVDSYVKSLLHFDGVDGAQADIDYSGQNHVLTFNGNAQLDTAQKVFGLSSLLLDGSGDNVSAPNHSDWDIGTGALTVDFRVRFPSFNKLVSKVFVSAGGVGHTIDVNGWSCLYIGNATPSGYLAFYTVNGGTDNDGAFWLPSINTWYHVAFVREADGTMHLFVDGVEQTINVGTGTNTKNVTTSSLLKIGSNHENGHYLNGWMDEIRISKGIARWTSNFTPPPYPYHRIARTINV